MPQNSSNQPDVYLNVPDVHVDELRLDVEGLDARLALRARLANLLDLHAGVDVAIANVSLDIKGVSARAMLKVRLENVFAILDRALTSLDRNPRLVEGVVETAQHALDTADHTIEGVARAVPPVVSRPRLGGRLRALPRPRARRVTTLATAAGLLSGAALAAHGNGGLEKTIKELSA